MGGGSSVIQQKIKQQQIQPGSEQQQKQSSKINSFKSPTANQTQKEQISKAKNLEIIQQKNFLDELQPNYISLKDLREKISRINLPICMKGQNHSKIEFCCVDRNCQPVDQLKLLCQNCIQNIVDENIGDHVQKDVIQILLSLVNQVDPKRPQIDIFNNQNINVGDIDIDEIFNNLINRISTHIQKCDQILTNIRTSQENIKNNRRDNDVIVDQQEVRAILELIIDNNTEKNLMKGFKKIKNYSIIYEDDLQVLNIHRTIEKQIQEKTFIYSQTFNQKLAEIGIYIFIAKNKDQIMSGLLKLDILEKGEDIFLQRENEKNRIKKQISQKYIALDQKKLEEQKIRQNNLRRKEEERQKQLLARQEGSTQQESPPKKDSSSSRQKQELYADRQQMVFLMENHIKQCDNIMCRSVEWGMETEYKYIGVKDNTIAEGRRKTTCFKGKELNHSMKEIIRKLKLIGE